MSVNAYIADADFTLYVGDVREVLATLPDESVQCVVTSPPYWGLRDYGVDGQLGLEPTPELYVENMVAVFREVRRVLRRDGTCWLNVGDSYATTPTGNRGTKSKLAGAGSPKYEATLDRYVETKLNRATIPEGMKSKDLVGIPWALAFALRADGWYLRSEIVWSKPNPMPESVTDRPTKSHEQVFLLTRSPRYFYDADAVREPARWGDQTNAKHEGSESAAGWIGAKPKGDLTQRRTAHYNTADRYGAGNGGNSGFDGLAKKMREGTHAGRNLRSVWEIPTEPFPEAHFATYPQALVERCVKAGTKPGNVVLDPFLGSGTTALVARRLGRRSIGIELNEQYAEMAARRLGQQSLLAEIA